MPYPWQQQQWQHCLKRLHQNRLPHALLLHGSSGLGIEDFSRKLAQAVLCLDIRNVPCRHCRSCRLFESDNHPDFQLIQPLGSDGSIKIDAIRRIGDFMHVTDHYRRGKVTVILSADTMTYAGANSLLKILEEPPGQCRILLVGTRMARFQPTVVSRCQKVYFPDAGKEQSVRWLAERSDYSVNELDAMLDDVLLTQPLDADALVHAQQGKQEGLAEFKADCQGLLDDSVTLLDVADKWAQQSPQQLYQWMLQMTHEKILACYSEQSVSAGIDDHLYKLYRRQVERYRSLGVKLNPRLMLESALLEFRATFRKL